MPAAVARAPVVSRSTPSRYSPLLGRALANAADLARQGGLGTGADEALHELALAEEEQRREAHDVVEASEVGVLLDVHLDHCQRRIAGGQLVEDRRQQVARAAPLGPAVDDDDVRSRRHRLGDPDRIGLTYPFADHVGKVRPVPWYKVKPQRLGCPTRLARSTARWRWWPAPAGASAAAPPSKRRWPVPPCTSRPARSSRPVTDLARRPRRSRHSAEEPSRCGATTPTTTTSRRCSPGSPPSTAGSTSS